MKIAIIGSRNINPIITLLHTASEIVSGGAIGVDSCAKKYAIDNDIKLVEFLPDYKKYGRAAPIVRNKSIVEYCDVLYAFWDGKSKGTKFTIDYALKSKKTVIINGVI